MEVIWLKLKSELNRLQDTAERSKGVKNKWKMGNALGKEKNGTKGGATVGI